MAIEKKLYRARQSIGGGVCTGIANYFKIDPIIVQIITVVLAVASGGLLIIAYVALWIILPQELDPDAPVVVQAHEVHSDTYGQVDYWKQAQKNASAKSCDRDFQSYAGNAHIPPEPPKGSVDAQVTEKTAAYHSAEGFTTTPAAAQVAYSQVLSPDNLESSSNAQVQEQRDRSAASGALWFGFFLLFIGLCALFAAFISGVEWWQFWPLFFVIIGMGQMIVPGKKGHRKSRFTNGLLQFVFCIAALPFSLGIIGLASIEPIFMNLWPILVIMCGLFILGGAMDTPLITLLGCFCFIIFCVAGIGWFSYPGPTDMITLSLPTGQVYSFDIERWIWPS